MALLRFKPIPKQTVWGGNTCRDYYHYDWMPDGVGQAWAFADQGEQSNVCVSGEYEGKTLGELWREHSELFGDTNRQFPVIISLLCPVDDLSIQVHPDTEHAKPLGFESGKNEAWYFLEAAEGSELVWGHNATDEADLRNYIAEGRWADLIDHLPIEKDDFVYLPAGLLHACCKNVIAYEIQQATDVTYRFYDYDRVQADGSLRELHLEQAIDCLSYDKSLMVNQAKPWTEDLGNMKRTHLISNDSFTVEKIEVTGPCTLPGEEYKLVTVGRGSGTANGEDIAVGDQILLPKGEPLELDGNVTLLTTTA